MAARGAERTIESAARQAGIAREVTPHTLRHTSATRYLDRGGTLPELRDVLGHASIATTGRYTHSNAAQVQQRVEEL